LISFEPLPLSFGKTPCISFNKFFCFLKTNFFFKSRNYFFITNAIKYSPNSKKIEIEIFQKEEGKVSVSIRDFGIGISKAHIEKIFTRFYRVDGKNEETFSGFGIGLFLVKEIIERHEGTIKVESKKGKGSKFVFTLDAI